MVISILPQLIYSFNANGIEIPADFLVDIDKIITKCMWKGKITRIAKTIFTNKVEWITLLDFKNYSICLFVVVVVSSRLISHI